MTPELEAFVPPHVRRTGPSPSTVAWLAATFGVGAWTAAGLYPRLDHGELRLFVTVGAIVATTILVRWTQRAVSPDWTAVRSLLGSIVHGAVLSFVTGMGLMLSSGGGSQLFALVVLVALYSLFFGGIPGLLYGIPLLAILAPAKQATLLGTADARTRARRTAGVTVSVMGGLGLAASLVPEVVLTTIPLWAALVVGAAVAIHAQVELHRRRRWVQRVRDGHEPFLGLRPCAPGEDVELLPSLAGDDDVLEVVLATGHYRANAAREPLARV